ncbi:MAG: GTP-binding protein, partial [Chloroflexi bacterium]|nr:GTP-binding protein [Chloroflexota bacterium]
DPLARARPYLAGRDARAGGPWVDGEGLAWTDPFRPEVWEYNVALAVEAARLGFDEIQYDYVRFPTDPSAATSVDRAVYSQPNDEARRGAAIAGLLRRTQEALRPYPVRLSVDVFGYTTWHEDDLGIGQHIEALAPHLDVLAPMVYPSTYADGLPLAERYVPAARYPYEIVNLSVRRAVERLRRFGTEVRPWLQYFNDYTAASVPYGAAEIEAQKRATRDAGGRGWMFWDPTNRYQKGGFARRG